MPEINSSFEQNIRVNSNGATRTQRLNATFGSGTGYGGVGYFEHHQITPATTWTVSHGMNKKPSVSCFDESDNTLLGDISFTNDNIAVITFSEAVNGWAYFN